MIKKIISLFKSAQNPSYFKYRLCHATRRYMSFKRAKSIAKKNYKDCASNEINEFILPTYDGSNQSVHPDTIADTSKIYLVVTPYPYGMEEYENPCVYIGQDLQEFESMKEAPAPIAYPQKHKPGVHLSDPCLILQKDILRCIFRESIRKSNGEENILKYADLVNGLWTNAKIIVSSNEDSLISPALLCNYDYEFLMFHVNAQSNENLLVMSKLSNDMKIIESKNISCYGMPSGYRLWHISVYFDDLTRKNDLTRTMIGLFTLKNYDGKGDAFKLYYATGSLQEGGGVWTLQNEIQIDKKIKSIAKFVYKSSFIPNENKILLSFRDKSDRYRLAQIEFECKKNARSTDK